MPKKQKKTKTWILVADGARARILLSEGWQSGLALVHSEENEASTEPTRDLGSDRPGRVHDSADVGRHAMAPRVDWQRQEKAQFAARMAAYLNKGAKDGAFDRLVLVAPPQALGDLRAKLDKCARTRVSAELNKDLTNLAEHELPAYLEKITPV